MNIAVTLITDDAEQMLYAQKGECLSAVFARYNLHFAMPCGGKGICSNCPVFVDKEMCLICQTRVEKEICVQLAGNEHIQNIAEGSILTLPPVSPMFAQYGVAVDIGTTTLCATLLDRNGNAITMTEQNPQTVFGADIISPIEHALSGKANALAACIRNALSEMIVTLCARRGIDPGLVDALVLTGNTAMLYLLTGHDPVRLSRAPFSADRLFGEFVDTNGFGFPVSSDARMYLPRCISAFVGGDITCAILASGMCVKGKTTMLVDIGTNGEIALWHGDTLRCCSTAMGPALEGAGITHGTYGINGAIDRVWQENGVIRCATIGGGFAKGICGSGIIDAIAVMLELGIIEETGAFSGDADWFALKEDIGIAAADVRNIQLAKAALRAGIETLLEMEGVKQTEVETIFIAGGFGSLVNLENAAKIGLLPEAMIDRTSVIGNAAHTGAIMLLRENTLVSHITRLSSQARTILLEVNPVFADNYVQHMMF